MGAVRVLSLSKKIIAFSFLGTMVRWRRDVIREISSSISDDSWRSEEMEMSEEIEESEEERFPLPQLVVRRQWESKSWCPETTIFDDARFTTLKN